MGHLNRMLDLGVLTGSRAFNCSTPESDWDIVITQNDVPKLIVGFPELIISDTDFTKDGYVEIDDTFGFDVSDHEEFDEDTIEYDQPTIWGPLDRILKYHTHPDSETIINLFVYSETCKEILPKFIELNNLMNFLYGNEIKDKQKRIEVFIKLIKHVGITDFLSKQ